MATADENLPLDFRDWQHAARLFRDGNFQFAPKQRFLYHVFFSINNSALKNPALVGVYRNEIGLLAKSLNLPQFDMKTEALRQYNRIRNVTTHIQYKPVTIKFHDDNLGLINQMWQNYYTYMFADSDTAANGGYDRNAMKKATSNGYGLNGVSAAFFNYITISQLARGSFVTYKLINPIISSWQHSELDYSKTNDGADNSMTLQYEAVVYSSGTSGPDSPEGFRTVHYDNFTSPLSSIQANANATKGVTSPVTSTLDSNPQNTAQQINNYSNNQSGQLASPTTSTVASPGTGGLQGVAFPTTAANNSTQAKPVSLG